MTLKYALFVPNDVLVTTKLDTGREITASEQTSHSLKEVTIATVRRSAAFRKDRTKTKHSWPTVIIHNRFKYCKYKNKNMFIYNVFKIYFIDINLQFDLPECR